MILFKPLNNINLLSLRLLLFFILVSNVNAATLWINEQVVDSHVHSLFLLPKQSFDVKTTALQASHNFASATLSYQQINGDSLIKWQVTAPETSGLYPVAMRINDQSFKINLWVLTPVEAIQRGKIGRYNIGQYPDKKFRNLTRYTKPSGFIKVLETEQDTSVSAHFLLSDFLCKQVGGFPKYVVINPQGLTMLEQLVEALKKANISITRFAFISAYRTPHYNKAIGNVKHSRHVYGDAFDIYIDENKDGHMDDLNQDGKQTFADVQWLYQFISDFQDNSAGQYKGGVGLYKATSRHHGFVHVDNRGYRARW